MMDTLAEVIARDEHDGYTGQFRVVDAARMQCLTCRREFDPHDVRLERLDRLEGASDPADLLAVAGLRCPHCETCGTVVLNYGPEAPMEEDEALSALEDDRRDDR